MDERGPRARKLRPASLARQQRAARAAMPTELCPAIAASGSRGADSVEKNVHDDLGHGFEFVAALRNDPVGRHLIERAEKNFRDYLCIQVFAKHAGALAFFED